jgi:hypothetical protein
MSSTDLIHQAVRRRADSMMGTRWGRFLVRLGFRPVFRTLTVNGHGPFPMVEWSWRGVRNG